MPASIPMDDDEEIPPPRPADSKPDFSPEARRRRARRARAKLGLRAIRRQTFAVRTWEVVKRVAVGAYNDGFIHAGNLAYLAVLSLFPFFITATALFSAIGEESERAAAINAFLLAVPPVVANVIEPVARDVIEARSGWLLWAGGAVGLWTVGNLVETIRDVLRRSYGTRWEHAFWRYRLASTGVIIAAVVLLLISLALQVMIGTAQEFIDAFVPQLGDLISTLALSRFVPAVGLYFSLYLLFYSLTPGRYRKRAYPKWPGALLVTLWWMLVTNLLPQVLRAFFAYDLTYGSLAGVMIALFFFWLVGLGLVVGAELNAALAETPEERDLLGQSDNRERPDGDDKNDTNDSGDEAE